MFLVRWGPSWAGRVHGCQLVCMWQESMCVCDRKARDAYSELACTVGGASLVVQMAKSWPAVQETQVPSLGQEDSLEKGTAAHSSTLAWRIPWAEKPGRLLSLGRKESGTSEGLMLLLVLSCIMSENIDSAAKGASLKSQLSDVGQIIGPL